MPIRNLRARGGGITSPNQSSARSPNRITRGPIMARGDDNENGGGWEDDSIASGSKYKDRSGGDVELTLYEKLQQQQEIELYQQQQQQLNQQQTSRERGPLLDSDHTTRKHHTAATTTNNASDNNSIASGWSWETRSSLNASRVQTKYANKKDMVLNAFGNENVIKERIMNVMNCTKNGRGGYNTVSQRYNNRNDGEDSVDDDEYHDKNQQHQSSSRFNKIAKVCLSLLLIFMSIRTINHKRNNSKQLGVVDDNIFTMSEQYLRGQLDGVLGGETSTNSINGGDYTPNVIRHEAIFPKHLAHLTNLTTMYNPQIETPYFWDVHFSGESIAEHVFSSCHELVLACEFGLRQPDYNEDNLETFVLDGTQYVNVDTTTGEGIQRASQLGLASSHLANIIISPHFHDMASQIFSPTSPGRMFALFRHPVDRAISMYYYLAKASWDPHYNPELGQMTVEQYAKSQYIENNWLTRFLVSKPGGKLTHSDMLMAKKIVKFKCLVGLYDDIETSLARFQRYFGWNSQESKETNAKIKQCRSEKVTQGDKNVAHPTVRQGSVAYQAIVRQNMFDMELYEYVKKIYRIQGEQIFDVVGHDYESPSQFGDSGGNVMGGGSLMMQGVQSEGGGGGYSNSGGKSMAADAYGDSFGKSMEADAYGGSSGGKSMAADIGNIIMSGNDGAED